MCNHDIRIIEEMPRCCSQAKIAEAKIAEILAIHIKEASLTMDSDKLRHNSEQVSLC